MPGIENPNSCECNVVENNLHDFGSLLEMSAHGAGRSFVPTDKSSLNISKFNLDISYFSTLYFSLFKILPIFTILSNNF